MAVQLQLEFEPGKLKPPPDKPGEVIIPRPDAWQDWVLIILDHGIEGDFDFSPRHYDIKKRLQERLNWFSISTYEGGVCKECKGFVWCDDGKPRECPRCQNKETIFSLSEMAPYF
jgi:hypothetical protein